MPKPIVISSKEKCSLIVSPTTHNSVAIYAQKKKLRLQEATQELLSIALKKELKQWKYSR